MPRFSRGATKSRTPGPLSIQSKKRGTRKKMRRLYVFIPQVHGARRKRTSCSHATDGPGEDYDVIEDSHFSSIVIPSGARDLTKTESVTLSWEILRSRSG